MPIYKFNWYWYFVQVCPICRGPICHSTKKCGAQFAAKSARGLIYQGPICLEPQGVKYMSRLPPTEESCWTCEKVEPPCNNNEWWRMGFPFFSLNRKMKRKKCGYLRSLFRDRKWANTTQLLRKKYLWNLISYFETSYQLLQPHIIFWNLIYDICHLF